MTFLQHFQSSVASLGFSPDGSSGDESDEQLRAAALEAHDKYGAEAHDEGDKIHAHYKVPKSHECSSSYPFIIMVGVGC